MKGPPQSAGSMPRHPPTVLSSVQLLRILIGSLFEVSSPYIYLSHFTCSFDPGPLAVTCEQPSSPKSHFSSSWSALGEHTLPTICYLRPLPSSRVFKLNSGFDDKRWRGWNKKAEEVSYARGTPPHWNVQFSKHAWCTASPSWCVGTCCFLYLALASQCY